MLIEGKSGVNKSGLVIEIIGLRFKLIPSANSIDVKIGRETSMTPTFCQSAKFLRAKFALENSLKYILLLLSTMPRPNAKQMVLFFMPMLPMLAVSISPEALAVVANFALISSN